MESTAALQSTKIKWTKTRIVVEILGWLGAVLLLYAYFLIQTHKVKHDNTNYILLNIFGALCLMLNTLYHRVYPSVVTNGLWSILGCYALIKLGTFNPF